MTFRQQYIANETFIKSLKDYLKMHSFNAQEQNLELIKLVDTIDENALCEEIARLIFENRCIHAMALNKHININELMDQEFVILDSQASPLTTCLV